MGRKQEWFNDAVFWENFAPIMFDEARWAEVPAIVTGLERLSGIPARKNDGGSNRALDLCCGVGRVSLELAARGYAVSGVDLNATYLGAVKEAAAAEKVELELIHADVRDFVRPNSFDLAVNLYVSFGYFAEAADDRVFVKNAAASLTQAGVFVIETQGKEVAVRDFTEGEWFERAGGLVLTEYTVVDDWRGLRNRWILVKDGRRLERAFIIRLYSASELRALLIDAGFRSVDIYGEWDGSPYDHKARTLIAIAKK